jgi:hypothetical protein
MPSPSSSLATLRPDLASFEEFDLEMQRRGYVASRLLPVMDVATQTGPFGRIPIEQLLASTETKRAPGAGYTRGDWKFETDSYACVEHGVEEPVDDREAAAYASYFDAELVSTRRAYERLLQAAERRVVSLVSSGVTNTGAAAAAWSTLASATPITDIETACQAVYNACGMWPNAVFMSRKTARNARNTAQVLDRIKYSGHTDPKAGRMTPEILAEIFDVERVVVADATKNTANVGQTASLSAVWTDSVVLVARIATTNDMREPCLGRTFHWAGDGSEQEGRVETYREEKIRSDVVRVRHDVHEKIIFPEAGYRITGC